MLFPARFGFLIALQSTNLKSALAMRGSFIMRCTMMFFNNMIIFVNWWILLQRVESIGGWRLEEMALLWGIVATAFGISVFFFGGATDLARMISENQIDTYLLQPKEPLSHIVSSKCLIGGLGDIFSGVLLMYLSGYLRFDLLPIIALSVCLAMLGLTATNIIFQCAAFWVKSARELSESLWEFLITFSTYPGSIYRGVVRLVLYSIIPAGFFAIMPVQIVSTISYQDLLMLTIITVAYIALAYSIFYLGLRSYESGNTIQMRT